MSEKPERLGQIETGPYLPHNILINPGFDLWRLGTLFTTPPSKMTANEWFTPQTGATVARESDSLYGQFSLKATSSGGGGMAVIQGVENWLDYVGLPLTLSVDVKTTMPDVQIYIRDIIGGVDEVGLSAVHPGDGNWHRLTAVKVVRAGLDPAPLNTPHAFPLLAGCLIAASDGDAQADGATMVIGSHPEGVPFIPASPGSDLARAQRFYEVGGTGTEDGMYFSGDVTNGAVYTAQRIFATTKFAVPTITLATAGQNNFPAASGASVATSIGLVENRTANGSGPAFFRSDLVAEVT